MAENKKNQKDKFRYNQPSERENTKFKIHLF